MARAKRTDRAEARRRYRAQLAAASAGEELDPAEDQEPAAEARGTARTPPRRAAATPPVPPRPGIAYAFRTAFRPANFREDLAALPQLIRHRSVWLPVLISIGTTAVVLATGGSDLISGVLLQYFVWPPPIGAVFLSGFLAPRASYLTGAIAGLAAAICLAVLLAAFPGSALGGPGTPGASPSPSAVGSPEASASTGPTASAPASPSASGSPAATAAGSPVPSPTPSATGSAPTAAQTAAVASSFLISPLTGAFFGAAAAWYRRFLNLANPTRSPRRSQPARGKPRRR